MPNLRELRRDRIASARSVIPTDHGSVRGHRVDLGPLSQLSGVRRNSDYTYSEGMERYIARLIPRNVQYHNPERCNDLVAFVKAMMNRYNPRSGHDWDNLPLYGEEHRTNNDPLDGGLGRNRSMPTSSPQQSSLQMARLRQLITRNKRENKKIGNQKLSLSVSTSRIKSKTWKKEWGYGADFIAWQENKCEETGVVDLTNSSDGAGSSNTAVLNNRNFIDLVEDKNEETFTPFPRKREFSFDDDY